MTPKKNEDLLQEARDRFKHARDAESSQREREQEDLRFQVPEEQWEESARDSRTATVIDGQIVPARPTLSIPKLEQPIGMVLNQMRQAQLGINIHPLSPDAEDDVAEVIQGIYRQIERNSNANTARLWAADRAIKSGRGFYRIGTCYADIEGGHPFDQEITIERLLYQESVFFDPAATKSDFSDARYAFVSSWVPIKEFNRLYPEAKAPIEDDDFTDGIWDDPNWIDGEGDQRAVRVVEYFRKKMVKETLFAITRPMANGDVAIKQEKDRYVQLDGEEITEDVEVIETLSREREVPIIEWSKLTGASVLEAPVALNGQYIPIVVVLGHELQPFDEERRYVGMIRGARDAQRLYNYAASSLVEMAALEPKAPFIGAEGQFEGHEESWQQANTRNFPFLQYKIKALGDKPVPPPQRVQVDTSRMGPSMLLLNQADDFIQSATATFSPSLGRYTREERSGKAIQALQQEGDLATSDYIQQLVTVSMPYEAKVILDLIPKIYDRKGRLARMLDTEDKSKTILLNAPFATDPRTNRPVMAPINPETGEPTPPPPLQPGGPPSKLKEYDLRKGVYGVDISVGRAYQTRLEQGAAEIGKILEAAPDLMPIIGPVYFKYRDFPGSKAIADILTKVREMSHPGLTAQEGEPLDAQQANAKAIALEQKLQQAMQQMQEMEKALKEGAAKQEAMLLKAKMDNTADLKIAELRAQTDMQIQVMKGKIVALQTDHAAARQRESEHFGAASKMAQTTAEKSIDQVTALLTEEDE